MNENKNNLEFLDVMNIMSFVIGLMNYGENLTQGDKQDLMQELNNQISLVLNEIHDHLNEQDEKIDRILEGIDNDSK